MKKETGRIRVLIRSDDFAELSHEELRILCKEKGLLLEKGEEKPLEKEEELFFSAEASLKTGESVMLTGKDGEGCFSVLGLKRGYEDPVFEGSLTILRRKEGFLLINELPLESYIRKVIPSEMPSSYPLEALKAQAVCARTYAVKQMENHRMEEDIPADVDDSVSYQVYNSQPENDRSRAGGRRDQRPGDGERWRTGGCPLLFDLLRPAARSGSFPGTGFCLPFFL